MGLITADVNHHDTREPVGHFTSFDVVFNILFDDEDLIKSQVI